MSGTDFKAEFQTAPLFPPRDPFPITPDDANDLAAPARYLNVAAAGVVKITSVNGIVSTPYINAGVWFPVDTIARVWATGTDAAVKGAVITGAL